MQIALTRFTEIVVIRLGQTILCYAEENVSTKWTLIYKYNIYV